MTNQRAKRGAPSGKCERCHRQVNRLERDHTIPLWAGGSNDTSNLRWLCHECHRQKTTREFRSPSFQSRRRTLRYTGGSHHPVWRTIFILLIVAVVVAMIV